MSNEQSVFIRNWLTEAQVGVYSHEIGRKQRLRISLTLYQNPGTALRVSRLDEVVDYAAHKEKITALVGKQHYPLLETLAEAITAACFADEKVFRLTLELEKLDVFADSESCGIHIERSR